MSRSVSRLRSVRGRDYKNVIIEFFRAKSTTKSGFRSSSKSKLRKIQEVKGEISQGQQICKYQYEVYILWSRSRLT